MAESLGGCLVAAANAGVLFNAAVAGAAAEVRHGRELAVAQRWVDHSAGQAQAAQSDYLALLSELTAARREASVLRAALEDSDSENLTLSLEIRRLRRVS